MMTRGTHSPVRYDTPPVIRAEIRPLLYLLFDCNKAAAPAEPTGETGGCPADTAEQARLGIHKKFQQQFLTYLNQSDKMAVN